MFVGRSPRLATALRRVQTTINSSRSISAFALPTNCPSCQQPLPSSVPACLKCGNIQSVPLDVNSFSLLGVPYERTKFSLDGTDLRTRFRQAQAACHPDTWTSRGNEKKDIAQELSSRVNNAYQKLRDPLKRLHYILELNGVSMEETDKLEDAQFLTRIITARDDIEEADTADQVQVIQQENEAEMEQALAEVSRLVEARDWNAAKQVALRLKYLEGIRQAATERMDDHARDAVE